MPQKHRNTEVIKAHDITLRCDDARIVLRPLSDEHLPYLYKWNADADVVIWSNGPDSEPCGEEQVHYIYNTVSNSRGSFCFIVEFDGNPVGECWLQKMEQLPGGTDARRIDMMIGEKAFWGQGIGTVIIKMLVDFAFITERVDVLYGHTYDVNVRSRRAFGKNGFNITKNYPYPNDDFDAIFEMTREEYEMRC